MKGLIISLISAAMVVSCGMHRLFAEEASDKQPNVSFGAAGSFNESSVWERKKGSQHFAYRFAPGYGGGVVFEKMFNNLIGINSGIWFNRVNLDTRIKQNLDPASLNNLSPLNFVAMKITISGWTVSVPLSLIVSLNTRIFSFNILGGIVYTHIVESDIRPDNLMMQYKRSYNLLPLLNQPQFGFSLGVNFKFRVALFVDVFLGCTGNLYVTELFRGNNDIPLLYTINTFSGVMFRTNLFPIENQ